MFFLSILSAKEVICCFRNENKTLEVCRFGPQRAMITCTFLTFASSHFHECFYNSIETQKTCFLFSEETSVSRKRKQVVILITKMEILFAWAIVTSTACASSVFLLC